MVEMLAYPQLKLVIQHKMLVKLNKMVAVLIVSLALNAVRLKMVEALVVR